MVNERYNKYKESYKRYRDTHKDKAREYAKEWSINNRERLANNAKKWRQKNRNKYLKQHIKGSIKFRLENKDIILAQKKAWAKIKIKPTIHCEICKTNIAKERHHPDYFKPLEVKLLCIPCHHEIHRTILK